MENVSPSGRRHFPRIPRHSWGIILIKKLPGSRVLVKEDGSGSILTMAHLNPYTVMVRRRRYRLSYNRGGCHRCHPAVIRGI